MTEFLRIGPRFVNVADLHAIEIEPSGSILVTYGGTVQQLKGDEAQALLAWVQARDAAAGINP